MEREIRIRRIKRMLGIDLPPKHYGDPLPDVLKNMNVQKRSETRYGGFEEDIQVRIG